MLETRQQRRTDCATTAPMPTARPRASRSSPEAALRCAAGAGLDGDPRGRATLGRAVWCGATNQPPRRCTPPPRKWRDITHPNHPQFQPTNQFLHFDEFRAFGKALDPEAHARLVQANAERDGIPPGRTGHWAQIDQFEVLFDSVNYDPDIQYALAIGDYESPERKVVKRIIEPHDRIIEAGTAIGLVAMTGASIVGAEAVLTFDANPAIAADARTNFRRNGLDGIQSRVGVLRNERRMMGGEASVDFFVCKKFWMSRLDAASDPDVIRVEKVPVFCLEAEIRNHAANVLICDIEGGEYDLLYEAELASINKILIETHYWAAGKRRIDKLMRLLILEGFSLDLDHSCGHISLLTR